MVKRGTGTIGWVAVALAIVLGEGAQAQALNFQAAPGPIVIPRTVVIDDVNLDGFPDLLNADPFLPPKARVLLGNGSGDFTSNVSTVPLAATAGAPLGLATRDLNADGKPDLVVSHGPATGSKTSVLLGNGSGGFTQLGPAPLNNPGSNPHEIAIGDLNNDGRPDLASGNWDSASIGLQFATPTSFNPAFIETPTFIRGIAIADVNEDGNRDLIFGLWGGGIGLYLGNGSGGFAPAPVSPLLPGALISSVRVDDLDGDANLDIVGSRQGDAEDSSIAVLLGNGSGDFSAASGSPLEPNGPNARTLAIADLDGDSNLDIAAATLGPGVDVFLGNGGGGFAAPVTFTPDVVPFNGIQTLAVGDVNLDDKPDLVYAGDLLGQVLLNVEAPTTCNDLPATITGAGTIAGTASDDVILGSDGPDVIDAGDGNDTICALDAEDRVLGSGGNDYIDSGPADDNLSGGGGADVLSGGGGADEASYAGRTTRVEVTIGEGGANDGSATDGPEGARDEVQGDVENIVGTERGDKVFGNDGANTFWGRQGDDVFIGGSGPDTFFGGGGDRDRMLYTDRGPPEPVTVTIGSGGADDGSVADQGVDGRDEVSAEVEGVTGGDGNDTITGNARDNVLVGWGGADSLFGLGGADRLWADDGGEDQVINCGSGTGELAVVDPVDPHPVSCE